VSTRKVDDLVKALGADTGISKSEVSRICADLDEEVGAFRDRSLSASSFPYVFLDATYCKARVNRRVVSQAIVVATGVRADGWREVLGFAVGDSEDGAFWTAFLRSLKARGLGGVQLVISDAHTGLKQAISAVLLGAAWQRSSVNISASGRFPLVHLRRRERTLATRPFRSSGRPVPPGGGLPRSASGSRASSTWMSVRRGRPRGEPDSSKDGNDPIRDPPFDSTDTLAGLRGHRLGRQPTPVVRPGQHR
jgi:Transposase, Mutator family